MLLLWCCGPLFCTNIKTRMSSLACLFLPICFGLLLIRGLPTNLLMSSSWNGYFCSHWRLLIISSLAHCTHFVTLVLKGPSRRIMSPNSCWGTRRRESEAASWRLFHTLSVDVYIFPVLDLGSYLFTRASYAHSPWVELQPTRSCCEKQTNKQTTIYRYTYIHERLISFSEVMF